MQPSYHGSHRDRSGATSGRNYGRAIGYGRVLQGRHAGLRVVARVEIAERQQIRTLALLPAADADSPGNPPVVSPDCCRTVQ
jgi:hypothetical protein